MKKLLSLLLVTLLVSGCGTTSTVSAQDIEKQIRPGQSRVVIERDNSLLFIGAGAQIEVSGRGVGVLGRGGSIAVDLNAGPTTVTASATSGPGRFVVHFDAVAGKTYRFRVSPKSDSLLLGSAFGMIGESVHASISDTSGYFQVELVDKTSQATVRNTGIEIARGKGKGSGKRGRKGAVA